MKKILLIYSFIIFSKLFCADKQELKIYFYDYLSHHLCSIEIEKNDTIKQLINKISTLEKKSRLTTNKIESLMIYNRHSHDQIVLDVNDTVEDCNLWDLDEKRYHVYVNFECVNLSVQSIDGKSHQIPIFHGKSIVGIVEDIRLAFSVPRSQKIKLTFHDKVIKDSGFIDEIDGIFEDLAIQFITQDSRW